MKRLQDKIAIVTGGASGIGLAITKRFASEGAKIIIADLNLESAKEEAKAIGENVYSYQVDMTNSNEVQSLMNYVSENFNKLDIMVNNAGIGAASKAHETSEETWQKVIDVNLKGTFLGMKYSIPLMLKNKSGSVINITSIAALVGLPERAVYSAAKGGILSLTRAAAIDYVSDGIRINCIAPGTVDTPWIKRITDSYDDPNTARNNMIARQPHGRLVAPEEIAAMAAYLASDESKSTIGAVMVVDGGATAK